jgi:hypothetical protein
MKHGAHQEHSRFLLMDHLKASGLHVTIPEKEKIDMVNNAIVDEHQEEPLQQVA